MSPQRGAHRGAALAHGDEAGETDVVAALGVVAQVLRAAREAVHAAALGPHPGALEHAQQVGMAAEGRTW